MATVLSIRHGGGQSDSDEVINSRYAWVLLVSLAGLFTFCALFKFWFGSQKVQQSNFMARMKKHLIYAPLIRSGQTEFRLSSASVILTIPTRLQACIIFITVVLNIVLLVTHISWDSAENSLFSLVKNRAGTLATANLIPLVLLAGRHNPISTIFGISFSAVNIFHRWLGRIVVLEAVVHAAMWLASKSSTSGWSYVAEEFRNSEFIFTGLIAVIAFISLMIHSPSIIRNAFYETFLHSHILLVCLALGGLWHHLEELPARRYLFAAIGIWAIQRLTRFLLVIWRNCAPAKTTRGIVKEIPGEAFQISVTMARSWPVQPGQYVFIYIPSIGLWTSHPFTIAWYDQNEPSPTKESSDINVPQKCEETTIHLIVKRRTGFTAALHRKIQKNEVHIANVSPLLEGPYGGRQYCLDTYGTVILFAGGVGITHQLLYARHILNGLEEGILFGRRRIQLVWAIRNFEHLEWVRSWLECLFRLDKAKNAFHVQIFITRGYDGASDMLSLGGNLRLYSGRPDVDSILRCNVDQHVGTMAVTSCGPGTMSDQVRKACIDYQLDCNIDYFEGNYCW